MATRQCCNQQDGELYDSRGHCIFRDVMSNPRDMWRDCAMEKRGTEFAECYYREDREIEDELNGRGEPRHEHDGRDRQHHRHGHNHRDHREEILSGGRRHRENEKFECRVDSEDPMMREHIARQCCSEDIDGRYDQVKQICRINHRDDRDEFEQCAMAQGAQNAECYRD